MCVVVAFCPQPFNPSKKPTSLQETDCSLLLSFYLENKHKPKRVLEDIPVC
jgi:hypothetical protein